MPRTDEGCLQHVTYESAHQQQIWDDTLMMAVLPLAILGKMFDKPRWVEEAIYQFYSICTISATARAACGITAGISPADTTSPALCGPEATAG